MYESDKKAELAAIGQRFIEAYKAISKRPKAPSKGAFCAAVGISASNWSKYERGERPFDLTSIAAMTTAYQVSPTYLLFGEGEIFLAPNSTTTNTAHINNNSGIGINNGQATITLEACQRELEAIKRDAASYQREIELLKGQLEGKDALIAAKDEMLTLLRGQFNRPN